MRREKEVIQTSGTDGRIESLVYCVDASERRSKTDAILEVRQRSTWTVEQQTNRRTVVLRER